MAKKLKCWKKTGKDRWKKGKFNVKIVHNQLKQNYSIKRNGYDLNINDFKKKVQAERFAKSYMKKHDKC